MRFRFIVIPAVTIVVATAGSWLTSQGVGEWYQALHKPAFTPPGALIGAVWTGIYILATIAALAIYQKIPRGWRWYWLTAVFIANALLNVFWSYLFFVQHQVMAAFFEMLMLEATTIILAAMIWPASRLASILLWPYVVWVAFASYLTWLILTLNPLG